MSDIRSKKLDPFNRVSLFSLPIIQFRGQIHLINSVIDIGIYLERCNNHSVKGGFLEQSMMLLLTVNPY